MSDPRRDQVESTMYRYLAFWLATSIIASIIASIYLGWASIAAWVLSAAALMTLFYSFAGNSNE